jgi:TRAP-type C4-dicarboxylate transport system permease large subunit
MIVWDILTEKSIARLFLAGVIPGMILPTLVIVYIVAITIMHPDLVGEVDKGAPVPAIDPDLAASKMELSAVQLLSSLLGITVIISGVLGGIWFGVFTPTEGAGAGAAMAFGFDELSFVIVGILTIEAGLLTPPFGLLVFTIKAAIQDDSIGVQRIFLASTPYWRIMLFTILLLIFFPSIPNYLPNFLM